MRTSNGLENADLSSGIQHRLVQHKISNVSKKAAASMFRVKDKGSSFPQNSGKNLPPIHSVQSHKAVIIMKHTFHCILQPLCNVTYTHTNTHNATCFVTTVQLSSCAITLTALSIWR